MKRFIFIISASLYAVYSFGQIKNVDKPSDSIQEKLAFELAQIFAIDQGIRDNHILKTYPTEISKIMPAIDSINFDKFIAFIKDYGYPRKSLIGEYLKYENVKAAGLVTLLHNPRRLIEPEIYQMFRKEVIEGRLSAEMFALALDKYYVVYKGKSLYNSQFRSWPDLTIKGVSIVDKQLSDSLRMDIGLLPLAEDEFIYENQQP